MAGLLARIAVMFLGVSALPGEDEGYTMDSLDHVKTKVESKKAVLVDVREEAEWDQGHVRGAVLIPLSQLQQWEQDGLTKEERAKLAKDLPKGSVIYCHCAAGGRSLPGGELLRKLGYDARALKPGYRALIKAGFPKDNAK